MKPSLLAFAIIACTIKAQDYPDSSSTANDDVNVLAGPKATSDDNDESKSREEYADALHDVADSDDNDDGDVKNLPDDNDTVDPDDSGDDDVPRQDDDDDVTDDYAHDYDDEKNIDPNADSPDSDLSPEDEDDEDPEGTSRDTQDEVCGYEMTAPHIDDRCTPLKKPNYIDRDVEKDRESLIPLLKFAPYEQYPYELKAGDQADQFASNQHYHYPSQYDDFGRRFIDDFKKLENEQQADSSLIPKKVSPEFLHDIAEKSRQLELSKPVDPTKDIIQKSILRSGDYWNNVYVQSADPQKPTLRSSPNTIETSANKLPSLQYIKAKVKPESKLYDVITKLKKASPKLLYVINSEDD